MVSFDEMPNNVPTFWQIPMICQLCNGNQFKVEQVFNRNTSTCEVIKLICATCKESVVEIRSGGIKTYFEQKDGES